MDSEFPSDEPTIPTRQLRIPGCLVEAGIALAVIVFLILLLAPWHGRVPGEAVRRAACIHNMNRLGVALQNHHDTYKSFPPAYVADKNGRRMHSWRVLILPLLEDDELLKLHQEYRFDEPWNGPHNKSLAATAPSAFRCPSDRENESETNYLAVVGDETVWPETTGIAIGNITDGTSTTIAVVETLGSGINWLEPRDLSFEEAEKRGINPEGNRRSISSYHPGTVNVVLADGSVNLAEDNIAPEILHALLTRNGGERLLYNDQSGDYKLLQPDGE